MEKEEIKTRELNSIMKEVEAYIKKYKVKEFSITCKFEEKENDYIVIDIKNPTE